MSDDMNEEEDEGPAGFASPPCLLHEIEAGYLAAAPVPAAERRAETLRWRKEERQRAIAARLAIPATLRRVYSERIAEALDSLIGDPAGLTVSSYWPFRGEPDLRNWVRRLSERGGRIALPVVLARERPLVFRSWAPGERLEPGIWNIPVPAEGEEVLPDVVVAPVVGFDPACYRLGYGGGFFDRTLAAFTTRPRVIGVGYGQALLESIRPLPHDIALDHVVTESGVAASRPS